MKSQGWTWELTQGQASPPGTLPFLQPGVSPSSRSRAWRLLPPELWPALNSWGPESTGFHIRHPSSVVEAAAAVEGGATREPEGRVALQTQDKPVPSMCADATGAVGEELTGPPKVLMGGGGRGTRCGRVRDQGSGSRQALYTRRPPGKRTLDPGSELREEEKPAFLRGRGFPDTGLPEAGPLGK